MDSNFFFSLVKHNIKIGSLILIQILLLISSEFHPDYSWILKHPDFFVLILTYRILYVRIYGRCPKVNWDFTWRTAGLHTLNYCLIVVQQRSNEVCFFHHVVYPWMKRLPFMKRRGRITTFRRCRW